MKVDQRKKVSAFQSQFKREFGIGIRVYKGRHWPTMLPLKALRRKVQGEEQLTLVETLKSKMWKKHLWMKWELGFRSKIRRATLRTIIQP